MKVHNSVKLDLSKEELDAVQTVYNMLYDIELDKERAIDNCVCGASLEDIRTALVDIWELSGHNPDEL